MKTAFLNAHWALATVVSDGSSHIVYAHLIFCDVYYVIFSTIILGYYINTIVVIYYYLDEIILLYTVIVVCIILLLCLHINTILHDVIYNI